MIKYYLPTRSYSAVATHNGQYIFYLGKTVYAFDTNARKKIETLPRLGNAMMTVSNDDAYLGCIHPMERKIEAVIYRIQDPMVEAIRLPIRGQFASKDPCFTYDNRHLLVTVGFPEVRLYAVNVDTGEAVLMYQTRKTCSIMSVVAHKSGILVLEHEHHPDQNNGAPADRLLRFPSVTSNPVISDFDSSFSMPSAVSYQDDKLLLYGTLPGFKSYFQVVDIPKDHLIPPFSGIILPHGYILPPTLTTDGRYLALHDVVSSEGQRICVYRTADWTLVYSECQQVLWNLHFISNSYDLIISGSDSRVISIE